MGNTSGLLEYRYRIPLSFQKCIGWDGIPLNVVNSGTLVGCYNVTNEPARPKFVTVISEGYTIPTNAFLKR
jgi:hypothetical protein